MYSMYLCGLGAFDTYGAMDYAFRQTGHSYESTPDWQPINLVGRNVNQRHDRVFRRQKVC